MDNDGSREQTETDHFDGVFCMLGDSSALYEFARVLHQTSSKTTPNEEVDIYRVRTVLSVASLIVNNGSKHSSRKVIKLFPRFWTGHQTGGFVSLELEKATIHLV